jgi:uncharacterized protein
MIHEVVPTNMPRTVTAPTAPAARSINAGRDRTSSSQALAEAGVEAMLRGSWWGILATTVGDRPYAVPVAYGWNGTHVFIASLDGRKIRNLQANPHACLTITNVENGADWRSVVIEGRVEWVKSPGQMLLAFHALATQSNKPFVAPPASRLREARVFRIVPYAVSGRGRGPAACAS